MSTIPANPTCQADRTCPPGSGCGCEPPPAPPNSLGRMGLRLGLATIACAAACIGAPLLLGAAAASGVGGIVGALAGVWWLGLAIAALCVGAFVLARVRRPPAGGRIC